MGTAVKELTLDLTTPLQRLVLIGGGEFSFGETRQVDEFLLAHMPAGRRTVAFLPTASGSAEYARHIGAYFKQIDPSVETVNVPVYRGRDSRRQKNAAQLLSAGMIYFGGGVTNNVVETIAGSPAEAAVRDAAAAGVLVAAIGASASCFGAHVRNMRSGGSLQGFGWIRNTVVETGFDPADDVGLRRLMSVPEITLGIGIPPGTALAVSGAGRTEIIGSGSIGVFRKG